MPNQRTLAIECASEACSVALLRGTAIIGSEHQVLGRGHAEHLIPMIASLPECGHAERILVSRGPGSFTGVRIGIAAARALGVAWKVAVAGYPTLALVAAMAREQLAREPVTVCMTGGHGEWFVQDFDADGLPQGPSESLKPQEAAGRALHAVVAGSQAEALVALSAGCHRALPLLPNAACALLLPAAVVTEDLSPLYGRGPDAHLPG